VARLQRPAHPGQLGGALPGRGRTDHVVRRPARFAASSGGPALARRRNLEPGRRGTKPRERDGKATRLLGVMPASASSGRREEAAGVGSAAAGEDSGRRGGAPNRCCRASAGGWAVLDGGGGLGSSGSASSRRLSTLAPVPRRCSTAR
jgi:hypothetical protein